MIYHSDVTVHSSKNTDSKKICVAWFKLAELVSKREKEKALNLYRLIAHSFDDKAYVLQVEGDILWALQDNIATQKYAQAAYLYKKEKKFLAAAAVYEHVISLEPSNVDNLKNLILIYLLVSWPEKFEEFFKTLIKSEFMDQDNCWDFAKNIINFSMNSKHLDTKYFDKDILLNREPSKFDWVVDSLKSVLKDTNINLYDRLRQYCLDNNLNFDS